MMSAPAGGDALRRLAPTRAPSIAIKRGAARPTQALDTCMHARCGGEVQSGSVEPVVGEILIQDNEIWVI